MKSIDEQYQQIIKAKIDKINEVSKEFNILKKVNKQYEKERTYLRETIDS